MNEVGKFSIGRAELRIGTLPWWKRWLNKVGFNFTRLGAAQSMGIIDQVDVTIATEAMVEGEDKPEMPVNDDLIFTPEYELCSRALWEVSASGGDPYSLVKYFFMTRKRHVPTLLPLQRQQLALTTKYSLDTINRIFSPKDRYGNGRRV